MHTTHQMQDACAYYEALDAMRGTRTRIFVYLLKEKNNMNADGWYGGTVTKQNETLKTHRVDFDDKDPKYEHSVDLRKEVLCNV